MALVILDFANLETPLNISAHALAGAFTATGLLILGLGVCLWVEI